MFPFLHRPLQYQACQERAPLGTCQTLLRVQQSQAKKRPLRILDLQNWDKPSDEKMILNFPDFFIISYSDTPLSSVAHHVGGAGPFGPVQDLFGASQDLSGLLQRQDNSKGGGLGPFGSVDTIKISNFSKS